MTEDRLKQEKIPGVLPPRIKEIVDAAEDLADIRGRRMGLSEKEEKAQIKLKELLKKHKVKAYQIDDEFEAILEAPEARAFVRKIKRKKTAKGKDSEDESDGEGKKE